MKSSSQKMEYQKEILDIHNEFNISAELLLDEANKVLKNPIKSEFDKSERLRLVGFKQAKETDAKQGKEVEKAESIDKTFAKLIKYYNFNYPYNKFITEEDVLLICKKYMLVFGSIDRYKGFVPDINLQMIESFIEIVKEEDIDDEIIGSERYDGVKIYDNGMLANSSLGCKFNPITKKSKLKICAPITDMDLTGMMITDDYKLEQKFIPDPVILQPVIGGFLIVTAWGDEASDELVVNHNCN